MCMSSLDKQSCPLLKYFQKCSSWIRLKKFVAWLLRYRERLLNASKNKEINGDVPKCIILEEIEKAEREILKKVQRRAVPEEFNHPEKPLKKSSRLYKLDPTVIDGLLHVGGRLRKASLPMESKHQIILPKEDHVTRVIIDDYHRACGHSGREHVLASVRLTGKSRAGREAALYISGRGLLWPIPSPSWAEPPKRIWCDLHMSSNPLHCKKRPSQGNLLRQWFKFNWW